MNRLPNHAIAKAIVRLLRAHLAEIPITDSLDDNVGLPYIVVGDVTTAEDRVKSGRIMESKVQLHIYSDYQGKAEVDAIGEKVCGIFNAPDTAFDMTEDHFRVVNGNIESYETYEEDIYGYDGMMTLALTVQDLK